MGALWSRSNIGSSQPDSLDAIVERLDGAVSKVSQLRLFLGDLETELSEIRQQCQIRARTGGVAATNEVQVVDDNKNTIKHNLDHDIAQKTDIVPPEREPEEIGTELKEGEEERIVRCPERPKSEQKDDDPAVESDSKGDSASLIPCVSSSAGIPGSSRSSAGGVVKGMDPVLGPPKNPRISEQIPFQRTSRPPTHPVPFPEEINNIGFRENMDLSSFPPELKREEHDWFILFNQSPKVKRVLDVDLMHCITDQFDVLCVKFSHDGKWLATGGWGTAHIYNVQTGSTTCILKHKPIDVCIFTLCFSPDGRYLATGTSDRQIRVWDIAKKQIQIIFKGHRAWVRSLCFSPNGQFIVSGSNGGTVCIWDIHDRTSKVLTIDDHYFFPPVKFNAIPSVALSPDGRYVAVGSADRIVSIWEVATGVLVQKLREHKTSISCVAFTPDGMGLISGSEEVLKYWDVSGLGIASGVTSSISSLPCLMNFTGHRSAICTTAVSHDSNWVVSGGQDRMVLFWDTRTGEAHCLLYGHEFFISDVDMSPTGNLLATAGRNDQVRIWTYGVSE